MNDIYKKRNVDIIQATLVDDPFHNPVYGLGDDGRLYRWEYVTGKWLSSWAWETHHSKLRALVEAFQVLIGLCMALVLTAFFVVLPAFLCMLMLAGLAQLIAL